MSGNYRHPAIVLYFTAPLPVVWFGAAATGRRDHATSATSSWTLRSVKPPLDQPAQVRRSFISGNYNSGAGGSVVGVDVPISAVGHDS